MLLGVALATRPAAGPRRLGPGATPRQRALALPAARSAHAPTTSGTGAGRPGTRILAAARRLPDRRHARSRARTSCAARETIHYVNHSPDALPYLWLFVEQNICAPGSVTNQLNQPPLVFLGSTFDFSCKGFAGGLTLEHVRLGLRRLATAGDGTTMRIDLPRRSRRAQFARPRHRLALHGARLRRGPHGPRRHALRDRAVVSAHGGLRRRARLEPRAVHRRRASSTSSTAASTWRSPCRPTTSSARTGVLRNPEQVLTADAAAPARRARGARDAGRDHHRATRRATPRATRPAAHGHAHLALHRRQRARLRLRRRARLPLGRERLSTASWSTRSTARRRRSGKRPTGWRATRSSTTASSGIRYPYPHTTSIEGPIEGMEYPMLTFDPRAPSARRAAVGAGPRARATSGSR